MCLNAFVLPGAKYSFETRTPFISDSKMPIALSNSRARTIFDFESLKSFLKICMGVEQSGSLSSPLHMKRALKSVSKRPVSKQDSIHATSPVFD